MTSEGISGRPSNSNERTFKFPDFDANHGPEEAIDDGQEPGPLPDLTRFHSNERWQARRESGLGKSTTWGSSRGYTGNRHGRQKSLSEAIRTVRNRRDSTVVQNAVEIADALKAPVSTRLVVSSSTHAPLGPTI